MTIDKWKEAVDAAAPFPEIPGVRIDYDQQLRRYILRFDSPQRIEVTSTVRCHGWMWRARYVGWTRSGTGTTTRANAHKLLAELARIGVDQ